ncbi:MAG TPA: alpha-ketoacid dehydrogenase subunit beta [Candidatus Dormibacteraeota bacterium]|nr:alpha-ketoacid dehydrogenase subunit beta [Candidatus Dormibacteraeota bacterium]
MAEVTYVEAIRSAMEEEMHRDDRVLLMGEDVGAKGGVFGATAGLFQTFGEERVIDSPLAEAAIVGVAIGCALAGLRPVAEIQFLDFIPPAMDQIISEAAKIRYRSNNDWSCPMVIRAPCGGGVHVHGALYHSQSLEALFAHVPGLKVVMPSTPSDAKGLLLAAIRDPDPVCFFEHKALYRSLREEVPEGDYVVPIGKGRVVREGTDISCITYGATVHEATTAAERLAADGIQVEVIDLRTVRPLDREIIVQTVRKTGKVLVAHEANLAVGVGAEVAAIAAEECFQQLDAPVMRIGGPEVPAIPFAESLAEVYCLGPDKIEAKLRELAAY